MKIFTSLFFTFGVFLLISDISPVFAADKAEQFKFLVDGMRFEREKIISGVVRGKGERTLEQEIDGKPVSNTGPVEYFLAFDFLEGILKTV